MRWTVCVLVAVAACDTSSESACLPGSAACTATPVADGTPCDDGDGCTLGDRCVGGDCTLDECRAESGCVRLPAAECAECLGLECAACSRGVDCASDEAEHLKGTCCALGDALEHLGRGQGSEVVDLETDGEFAYLCGGFGMTVNDVRNVARPQGLGSVERRCQRIGIGPAQPDGGRIIYVSHHGDTWVDLPYLATYLHAADGGMERLAKMESAEILFEGMAWHDGHLYSATHQDGVRRYRTGANGIPAFVDVIEGFDNAWKIAALGDHLYVADGLGGLKVVALAGEDGAAVVATHATAGYAKDVAVGGGRVYVAMGGLGVDVFDIVAPGELEPAGRIDSMGSAESVTVADSVVAVAEWRHVATYDPVTLRLIATEDVRAFPDFDEHTSVTAHGDVLFVAEWEGLHVLQHRPGLLAPDIWVEEDLLEFPADRRTARALVIRNRGLQELRVEDISVADPEHFSVDVRQLVVPPGGADVVEVTFDPGLAEAISLRSRLTLLTNDPDVVQDPLDMYLIASETNRTDIGEAVPDELSFLDPTGGGDINALRGHVTVLAYFALF